MHAAFVQYSHSKSMQIGGSLCAVTSSSDTQITCSTPAHSIGEVEVQVNVDGKGRASGEGRFTYHLEVNSVSHCEG